MAGPPEPRRGRPERGADRPPEVDPFDDDSPAARRARERRERRRATGEADAVDPTLLGGRSGARSDPTPDDADPAGGSGAGRRRGAGLAAAASRSGAAARAAARRTGAARGGAPGPRGGRRVPRGAGHGGVATAVLADRRWRLVLLVLGLLLLVLLGVRACGGPSGQDLARERAAREAARPQLPGGGRTLFPNVRMVAFSGAPQDEALGALGVGSMTSALRRLQRQARPYARRTRPTMPGLHLISTIAQRDPGRGGRYSERQPASTIARHLRAARRVDGMLILDVQPGRADFLTETRRLERWLREPDVALALDPEWRMERGGQVPGEVLGSVGPEELQATFDEVARVVRENDLPPKLVVVHRFTENMIRGLDRVRVPEGVVPTMSIDGIGGREIKEQKYRQLSRDLPDGWRIAFKLFYEEDAAAGEVMTPQQVMALRPRPDLVIYE